MAVDQADKFVVEDNVGPEVMERIKSMQNEEKDNENIEFVSSQPATTESKGVDINLDAPPEEAEKPAAKKEEAEAPNAEIPIEAGKESAPAEEGKVFDIDQSKFEAFAKEQGMDPEEFTERLFRDKTFKIKVGGKEREVDYAQIKSTLSREESSQKLYDKLRNSDEVKLGKLAKAAKAGDKGALKDLRDLVVQSIGAKDADEMNDKLEDVKEKFDADKANLESEDEEFEAQMEIHFGDVRNDVDYEANLITIDTELKKFMPGSIFDQYWNEPSSRRAMYSLAASGRMEEFTSAFQEDLLKMSHDKRLELEDDPDKYGKAFLWTVERVNKDKLKPAEKDQDEDDGLSSVSTATRSKKSTPDSELPNFYELTPEQRQAWRDKNGIQMI